MIFLYETVGLQLLFREKGSDELLAVLQVRAEWNEETSSPESWPGACQVTAHGKLEHREELMSALWREVKEELGDNALTVLRSLYEGGHFVDLVNVHTTEGRNIVTFGVLVDEQVARKLLATKRTRTVGGFRAIRADELDSIVDLKTIDRKVGVTDDTTIAMFADDVQAVRVAFKELGKTQ